MSSSATPAMPCALVALSEHKTVQLPVTAGCKVLAEVR